MLFAQTVILTLRPRSDSPYKVTSPFVIANYRSLPIINKTNERSRLKGVLGRKIE